MRIRPENTTRRIDNLGRITIPKSLRDRMGIDVNDEMELFVFEDEERSYIAISPVNPVAPRFKEAAKTLLELGVGIPAELAVKLGMGIPEDK